MKLYAPKYYQEFVCIADKCRHSCCIGWEIDVDEDTLEKYRGLPRNDAKALLSSIETDNTPHFRLAAGERCPHLNSAGLCEIILRHGDAYLCDICREHPRFYHEINGGMEVGIGMACEEACRIILSAEDYNDFVEVEELYGESAFLSFDARRRRERLYAILSDTSVPYVEKLHRIYGEYGTAPSVLSDDVWRGLLLSLEYLDDTHRALFANFSSKTLPFPKFEKALERALAYFIFRHCTQAQDEDAFRAALGFCLFCERLLASVLSAKKPKETDGIIRLARIVSEELEYSEENTDVIKAAML